MHAAADGGDAGAEVDVPRGEGGILQDAVWHLAAPGTQLRRRLGSYGSKLMFL